MSESRFSWEILISGVLLTVAAMYMVNADRSPQGAMTATATSLMKDVEVMESDSRVNEDVIVKLRVSAEAQRAQSQVVVKQIESLKNLRGIRTADEIRARLEKLDAEIKSDPSISVDISEEIAQSVKEATKALAALDHQKLAIISSGGGFQIVRAPEVKAINFDDGVLVQEEFYDASSLRDVHLITSGGNISVTGGASDEIRVRVIANGKDATAAKAKERYDIIMKRNGEEVIVEVRQKDSGMWRAAWGRNQISMNIVVETPSNMQFNARTSGGNIAMSDLNGKQYLRTSGGNITMSHVSGSGEARTSGGNIKADYVDGNFSLQTSGGNVTMYNCQGNVTATTSGGNLDLDFLAGSLVARSNGGKVEARIHSADGDVDLSTSAGSINLSLPSQLSANLYAKGSTVRLDPSFKYDGRVTRNEVDANLNGGGDARITCRTSAGSINVNSF